MKISTTSITFLAVVGSAVAFNGSPVFHRSPQRSSVRVSLLRKFDWLLDQSAYVLLQGVEVPMNFCIHPLLQNTLLEQLQLM